MEPNTTGAHPIYSREALGARLRQARRWCGASQKRLAAASGVSESTLARYEKGRTRPRSEQLYRVVQALSADLEFLLLGENPPSEEVIAAMKLRFSLGQISQGEAANVVQLIDGILSQMPRSPRPDATA
jgi:transcriptional regulator with XRE-family HTH domain